jgi:hypothetical protein
VSYVLEWIDVVQERVGVAGFCERGSERAGIIKFGDFFFTNRGNVSLFVDCSVVQLSVTRAFVFEGDSFLLRVTCYCRP